MATTVSARFAFVVAAFIALVPSVGQAEALPTGYQPRACSFDLNDDGVIGDPVDDCNLCDGVTTDPDGDGVDEDLIYVDTELGSDVTGDGSPQLPYGTIQFAWNQADGPADGAEDIVCFTGVAKEEEIIPGTSGVPGVRIKPRSGNEARDWEYPSNPTMLVGWDTDNDGEYPPVDTDDLSVLDGGGNHVDTGLFRAFRFGAETSFLEVAHFTARDYGRFYPVELDGDGNLVDARSAGFVKFTTGTAGIGGHMYLHDLWIENINMDTIGGGHRITFDFFIGHTVLHYLAMVNLKIPNTSSFMNRGAAPSLPGQGLDGRDYGPVRWQNLSVTAHGKDQAPGVLGGFYLGWKLWGYMSGLEILDSEFDANLDEWNVGTFSVDFVNATQCSRDWTIRNNVLLDMRDALTAQGGNGDFCAHDTVNVPPKSIPRTTDDIVFEGNLFINYHEQQVVPVEIKGGDDPQRSVEDVTINNNLFVTYAPQGFGWCINAGAANDTGPGNPGTVIVANNTCFGAVEEDADRGAIIIGDSDRPADGQQANVIVVNNVIAGMGDNRARNIEMAHVPSGLLLDANVYDANGVFFRPGLFTEELSTWQAVSGWDGQSAACAPAFEGVGDINFRLRAYDTCAKNSGLDLTGTIPAIDLDGVSRPQQALWDAGAYETIEPPLTDPPLRYDGSPVGALPPGTTTAVVSLRTYRSAACRYDLVEGTSFASMLFDFTSGDGLDHQASLSGLADGQLYELFVRCSDGSATNDDDYPVAFSVEAPHVTALVAHWALNENLGAALADSSGFGNDAILLNGDGWTPGVVGAAIEMDGQNDWAVVSDPGDGWILDLPDALTIAAWVRPVSIDGQMKFVSKDNAYEFQMGQVGSGKYSIRLNNAGGGQGATSIVAGQWQHLVASWDGQTVRYFYNGQPDGAFAFEATIGGNNNDLGIGARPPGSSYLRGAIDEVRIYDGALSDGQALALYLDTTPPEDVAPPLRGSPVPASALPIGTESALVGLSTNEVATCRYSQTPGTDFADMVADFTSPDGFDHSILMGGLSDGTLLELYVRCQDGAGLANEDDYPLVVRVLRPTPVDFSPADIAGVEFFIQSTVFEDPSTYARSIALCNTEECLGAGNLAPIELQYCDTAQFPQGCIRRWDDLSGYLPLGGFRPPEWVRGRNFGQDDLEKPLYIADCVNGHPCARGGSGARTPDGSILPQNFSFEIEVGNTTSLPGEFSIFHLIRPVAQSEDYQYFGLNGVIHRVADNSLSYRASGSTVRITEAEAITNGKWQLLEVHRDSDGVIQAIVDGVDVTRNTPFSLGNAAGPNYLSGFKGDDPMFGDLAASVSYGRRLGDQELADIRSYLDDIYDYSSSIAVDTVPPARSQGAPTGQLPADTTQVVLRVTTDEEASCRFSATADVPYTDMTSSMSSLDGTLHEATLQGLVNDQGYARYVKCEDVFGNRNSDDYEIAFYVGQPGVEVGLIGHWPFEENGGPVALNQVDSSLDGVLLGDPTWVAGASGLGMDFDGVAGHAVVADAGVGSPLDVTSALTIALWVNPQEQATSGAVKLVAKDNAYEFEIGHAGPGTFSARLNNARRGQGATPIENGRWQHLAVVWDGSEVRYYFHGREDGSAAFVGPISANNSDLGIAARPLGSTGSGTFRGQLDEVRLYGRALSASEISDLVADSNPPVEGVDCPELPSESCRTPTRPGKSQIKMSVRDGRRDKLAWKWASGGETSRAAIGSPADSDDFAFCLYDSVAATGRLLLEQSMPAGETCKNGRPCWKENGKGAKYKDSRLQHGAVKKMSVRAATQGRGKVGLAARGSDLNPPGLPLSLDPWMRVQLRNVANSECWEAVFSSADFGTGAKLRAYSD